MDIAAAVPYYTLVLITESNVVADRDQWECTQANAWRNAHRWRLAKRFIIGCSAAEGVIGYRHLVVAEPEYQGRNSTALFLVASLLLPRTAPCATAYSP
jgi:hypothetical protein